MKLGEYVKTLSPDCTIRIGAKSGSGWFFHGTVGKINWKELNEEALKLNSSLENKKKFKPVQDREITENEFPSIRSRKTKLILVEGHETAKIPENDDSMAFSSYEYLKCTEGIENLAIAILKNVTDELRDAYHDYKDAANEHLACLQNVNRLENWIMQNCMSVLIAKEPEAIIDELRKEVFGGENGRIG